MIKNYLTFINERKSHIIKESAEFNGVNYQLSIESIKELFVDFIDEDFKFYIAYGFVSEHNVIDNSIQTSSIQVLVDEKYIPAIEIYISSNTKSTKNLTDSLQTAIDYLESTYNVHLYVQDGNTSKESLTITNGEFLVDDLDVHENYLSIYLLLDEVKELTQIDITQYYNLKEYVTIGDSIYAEINIEDMANMTLSGRSDYKDYIKDNVDLDHNYYSSDYQPSIGNFFSHLLTDDNVDKLLLKLLEKYSGDFLEENEINIADLKEDISQIIKLSKYSDILGDIQSMYGDWEYQDQFYKNVDEAKRAFDKCLEGDFEFDKITKEVEKSYTSEGEVRKYTEDVTIYQIKYDNKFIEPYDKSDIDGWKLCDLIKEFCYYISYELNPNFSDYGNVDHKEFNAEVANMLK